MKLDQMRKEERRKELSLAAWKSSAAHHLLPLFFLPTSPFAPSHVQGPFRLAQSERPFQTLHSALTVKAQMMAPSLPFLSSTLLGLVRYPMPKIILLP